MSARQTEEKITALYERLSRDDESAGVAAVVGKDHLHLVGGGADAPGHIPAVLVFVVFRHGVLSHIIEIQKQLTACSQPPSKIFFGRA